MGALCPRDRPAAGNNQEMIMDRETLLAAIKKIPKDATKIRVGALWSKGQGTFDYVSFEAPKANQFHWDKQTIQHQDCRQRGVISWIKRLPKS